MYSYKNNSTIFIGVNVLALSKNMIESCRSCSHPKVNYKTLLLYNNYLAMTLSIEHMLTVFTCVPLLSSGTTSY